MTYTLVTVFLLTGQVFVERNNLTLNACASHAAMLAQQMQDVRSKLEARVGKLRFMCLPEGVDA